MEKAGDAHCTKVQTFAVRQKHKPSAHGCRVRFLSLCRIDANYEAIKNETHKTLRVSFYDSASISHNYDIDVFFFNRHIVYHSRSTICIV